MSTPPAHDHDAVYARPSAARGVRGQRPAPVRRPWPVTANALLLLLGAAASAAMAALLLGPLGMHWPLSPEIWRDHRDGLLLGLAFALLATLALAASIGFARVAPGAWLLAVMVQGLNLGLALFLYFQGRPTYVYVMMVYGVVMVLYLHQADVQAVFRVDDVGAEGGNGL
jgi:hypothetical protein